MSAKDNKYLAEYKLINNWTNDTFQTRGWKNVCVLAGLSRDTPVAQIKRSKKWTLVQTADPIEWDEASYRSGLYKNTKHKYKQYEERKLLRDPLFEKRKRLRLSKWINKDGTPFTAEQHDLMMDLFCSTCGIHDPTKMCVDHCHKTNVVRGTLCRKCNLALGYVNDDIDILNKLIDYLKESRI